MPGTMSCGHVCGLSAKVKVTAAKNRKSVSNH